MGTVERVNEILGQTDRRPRRPSLLMAAVLASVSLTAASLTSCTISVPISEPSASTAATSTPSYAAPTIQAGHNAAAVAAKNMSFPAGDTLSPNVPVTISDVLAQGDGSYSATPPPPEWTLLANNVAGRTSYSNKAGCKVTYWTTTNQGPLIVPRDDRASTVKLFSYLLPSVLPDALRDATWGWVAEPGKKGPTISMLRYSAKAANGAPASTVWARMLGTSDTGLVISISCPTDALLKATTPRVMAKLVVVPPTE